MERKGLGVGTGAAGRGKKTRRFYFGEEREGLELGEKVLKQESLEKRLLWSASFWESWEKGEAKIATRGFGVTRLRETQGVSNPFLSLITGRGTL